MRIVQATLKSIDGNEMLTTWLDVQPKLKEGAIITLRDFKPEKHWMVERLFAHTHEAADFNFHRKWDNNNYDKHEGLGIKV